MARTLQGSKLVVCMSDIINLNLFSEFYKLIFIYIKIKRPGLTIYEILYYLDVVMIYF